MGTLPTIHNYSIQTKENNRDTRSVGKPRTVVTLLTEMNDGGGNPPDEAGVDTKEG